MPDNGKIDEFWNHLRTSAARFFLLDIVRPLLVWIGISAALALIFFTFLDPEPRSIRHHTFGKFLDFFYAFLFINAVAWSLRRRK